MKTLIQFIIIIQLIVTQSLPSVAEFTYDYSLSVPLDVQVQLTESPLASAVEFTSNGVLYRGYYAGMIDRQSGQSCKVLSQQCAIYITDIEPMKRVKNDTPGYRVIRPNEKGYSTDLGTQTGQSNAHGGQNGSSKSSSDNGATDNKSNNPSGQSNYADNGTNSQSGGSTKPWYSDDQKILGIGNEAINNGVKAGFQGAIVIYLGKEKYIKEFRNLQNNQTQLRISLEKLNKTEEEVIKDLYRFLKSQNLNPKLNITIPIIRSTGFTNNQPFQVEKYKEVLNSSDSNYRNKVQNLAKKLNNYPDTYQASKRNIQILGKTSLENSIESRQAGDIETSNFELKISEEMVDLLYGLDPVTGLHRDLYELITGENLITGQKLTTSERALHGAFAVVNAVTLGIVPTVAKGTVAVGRLMTKFHPATTVAVKEIEKTANKIGQLLKKIKNATVEKWQKIHRSMNEKLENTVLRNQDDVDRFLDANIKEKTILSNSFKKEFIHNPGSQESVEFIKNKVDYYGLKADKIYPGTNDEIYIIGRRMGDKTLGIPGVETYAESLIEKGFTRNQIKIFIPEQNTMKQFKYLKNRYAPEQIPLNVLKKSKIWEENKKFIRDAIGSQNMKHPTIINLERDPDAPISYFYDKLELDAIQNSWRVKQ